MCSTRVHEPQATQCHISLQVQQHLEGPIGMALYEWQDGQIGMACVHGGIYHHAAFYAYALPDTTPLLSYDFFHHADKLSITCVEDPACCY